MTRKKETPAEVAARVVAQMKATYEQAADDETLVQGRIGEAVLLLLRSGKVLGLDTLLDEIEHQRLDAHEMFRPLWAGAARALKSAAP